MGYENIRPADQEAENRSAKNRKKEALAQGLYYKDVLSRFLTEMDRDSDISAGDWKVNKDKKMKDMPFMNQSKLEKYFNEAVKDANRIMKISFPINIQINDLLEQTRPEVDETIAKIIQELRTVE
jgi:hypothetical protein